MLNLYMNTYKNSKGNLILIGGAEDRRDDKYVLKKVLEWAGNPGIIAVIPSASGSPAALSEDYYYAFRDLGVAEIRILDMRDHADAQRQEFSDQIIDAGLVFFTGGDQVRLFDVVGNTRFAETLTNRFLHDGLTVAGTSAGAAVMSDPMIYDGNYNGMVKGTVSFSQGLGFIKDITVDTHFVARGRLGRLTQFLCTGKTNKGIGLGENTGLFISPDMQAEIYGSGMVSIVNADFVEFSNYNVIENEHPITINGLQVGFLQDGCKFDLNTWKVTSCDKANMNCRSKVGEEVPKRV